jgi:hypothetical protein
MRTWCVVVRLPAMSLAAPVCLTIELDLSADPIAGVVRHGIGPGEPFAGWMALTRAIELTIEAIRGHVGSVPLHTQLTTPPEVA